jgi:DNA-directed RNA polymerase specialized sigma24 family protein
VPLALHDVRDARALVAFVVSRSGIELSREDREDLEQSLLLAVWQLHCEFDPTTGRSFAPFATAVLRRRLVDYQRSQFRTKWVFRDRVHIRERPKFVEFDDSVRDRLDATHAAWAGDREAGGDPALARLLGGGGGELARDLAELGIEPTA